MNSRVFSGLFIASIVVVLAVVWLVSSGPEGDSATSQRLFPQLAEQVNEVDTLVVRGAGGSELARLQRGQEYWQIDQLGGYPAQWSVVKEVLAALAQTRVLEAKTSNPAYFERLGVEDVSEPAAGGVELQLGKGDQVLMTVILGDLATSRDGRYARISGQNQSVLLDFDASVPREATGWANDEVLDIAADSVAQVGISHADGEQILIRKVSADDNDYTLVGLPEGRELASSWSVNSLAGVFAGLVMDDVKAIGQVDWVDSVNIEALTFAGLTVSGKLANDGEHWWLQIEARSPENLTNLSPSGDQGTDAENTGVAAASTVPEIIDLNPEEDTSVNDQALSMNQRVQGWAYRIPGYKADLLNKRMEELLKPLDEQ